MSDSNPFDDLAEEPEESEESEERAETNVESGTRPAHEPDTEPTVGSQATTQETTIEGPSLSNSSPPFPYSEAQQKQVYVRDGLWDEFEDLGFDAELELRRTFDIRNVEHRELDTAIIRLVLERLTARDIAEMVIQMRGFDPPNVD